MVCILTLLGSCNKSERDEDVETLSTRELAIALHTYEGIIREVHRYAITDSLLGGDQSDFSNLGCISKARLNKSIRSFPITLTITYDSNQTCDDEVPRSGVIEAIFSGQYMDSGSVITVDLKNLIVNDRLVSGELILTNEDLNSNGSLMYDWRIRNARIQAFNTDITWRGRYKHLWTDGAITTSNFTDDEFQIAEGSSSGRNSRGNSFSSEITSALELTAECKWIIEGRCKLEVDNLNTRTLNYGESDCDNVVVSRRNNTYFDVNIDY
ncbi:MAG: hypothetical protein Salg2KO_16460 [Salibacteraceae bacterium]